MMQNTPSDKATPLINDTAIDNEPPNYFRQESQEMAAALSSIDTPVSPSSIDQPTDVANNQPATDTTSLFETPSDKTTAFDGDTSRANPTFRPILPQPKSYRSPRQLILDTETTGLDAANGDRIIEIGIVEVVNRKLTGEKLHVYINPERGMDADAIKIHGIELAFLADMPVYAEIADAVLAFVEGAEIIAHNAPFDIGFLHHEFSRIGITDFADRVTVTDSLALAKQSYPGQRNSLDALVNRLNVGKQERTFHGALLDAEILAEVYLAMTGGQVSLAIDDSSQLGAIEHQILKDTDSLVRYQATAAERQAHDQWLTALATQYPNLAERWQIS